MERLGKTAMLRIGPTYLGSRKMPEEKVAAAQ
jgi:hypothetical protein